jgi:predicted O-methyltransferase YrrM
LTKTYEPELVVELGIDEGDNVAHFANGCSKSKIYGIDVHKDWEYPSTRCKTVEKTFPNFTYLRGWTWDKLHDIERLGKPIDILFIDSWHEPDYLIRDWNDFHKLLRPGSLVMVDDLHDNRLYEIFEKFPGERILDRSMGTDMGILIYDGSKCILPYTKQDYMN